jgi:hypothetical protein
MDNLILFNKLSLLPDNVKQEVSDFIDKLLARTTTSKNEKKNTPKFGSAKGKIIMHDDFDEPLDCFKEYIPNE